MTLIERLRKYKRDRSGYAEYCHQAADEIDRLTAENAALREERDALAATIRELDAICTPVMRSYCAGSRLADYKAFIDRAHENGSAILAASDAQTRANALLDAAEKFHCEAKAGRRNDAFLSANQCSESVYHTTELRRMADAIKKEAENADADRR